MTTEMYPLSQYQYNILFTAANTYPIFFLREPQLFNTPEVRSQRAVRAKEIDDLIQLGLVTRIWDTSSDKLFGAKLNEVQEASSEPLRFYKITDIAFKMFLGLDEALHN